VLLDIFQPFYRGRLITLEDGKNHWVSFKYERLPNLCYWCGCLTHGDRDCTTWIESEGGLNSEDQQFGSWLRASPFNFVRKKVVFVPGFFAKKKVTNPTTPVTNPPPNPLVTVHLATLGLNPPSPKALNENPRNQGIESVRVSIPIHQDALQKSEEGLAPISSKPGDFEKTLQDLDRDIHGFEKGTEDNLISKDFLPATVQTHSAQTSLVCGPSSRTPPVQLTKPIPLNDRSNMVLDHNDFKAQSEGKWLRIQRPIHSNENNISEVVLGKCSPLISLESSTPSKRRALTGAAQNENDPPSSEAVL